MKKIVTVFIMLSLLISLVCLPAHAENIYPTYFDSLASTTGSYTSYKGTQEIQLLCSYTHPSSGDAGIYFYQPSAGLSASFIHSNNRRGTIMLAEKDDEWFNYDDIVTYYIGYFSTGSDGRQWCTTTIYKQPNKKKFELYMPDTTSSGGLWNGLHLTNQLGHCYGISQLATTYYEDEKGYTYDQMVSEFMSPGVEITSINGFGNGNFGNFNGQIASTKGTVYLPYELSRVLSEHGSSVDAFNGAIKSAVMTAGPGTRAGVVAAANTLISGLAQYGYQLPYISSRAVDSGYHTGFGVRADWGAHGSWYNSYYNHTYHQKGLDCSAFTAWAVHNGGFRYISAYSGDQHNVGKAMPFRSYQGQPGDIVWHSGHVGLILGISEDGKYLIAEEQGDPTGLIVTPYRMDGSTWAAIVDMSDFYANPSNLDLSYYQ